jgi:hypothetical protein
MHNPENKRIKRAYFVYLKEARRLGEHSVDCAAAALAKFEDYTRFRDFKRFHIQQAIGFKRKVSELIRPRTGERLSRGTVFSTLNALRGFFLWLATQPGYRSHLTPPDAEYFALSDKETRIAKAALERPVPTIEQIRHVLARLGGLGQLAKPKPLISQESSCKGLHYGAGSEAGAEAVIFGGGWSGRTSLSSPSSSLRSLSGSV